MPIDTSIYQNIKPIEMPSMLDSRARAANLSGLTLQNQEAVQKVQASDRTAHLEKAAAFGEALNSMAGMAPEQRAQAYPLVREQLIQQGVITPEHAPEQYDDGFYRQSLMRYKQTEPFIKQDLQKAQAEHYRAEAIKNRAEAGKEKAPKQNEFSAATFGTRAHQAEDVFGDLAKNGFDATGKSTGLQRFAADLPIVGGLFERSKGADVKRQDQAERNFVNAILRRESGAAISSGEFENAKAQYFPQGGDSPEVLKQKEQNRKTATAALMAEGAPAMGRISNQMSGMTLGSSVPAGKEDGGGLFGGGNAYAGSPPKSPAPPAGMIRMKGRDGVVKLIPEQHKGEAIAQGASVVK